MDNIGVIGAFYTLAGVTVLSSLAVFAVRNLLHAVVFLVLAFVGMAGLFITLSADFLAVAQVLIYAGAVAILLVFAVMLTPLADRNNANSLFVLPGVAVGGGFAAIVALIAVAYWLAICWASSDTRWMAEAMFWLANEDSSIPAALAWSRWPR